MNLRQKTLLILLFSMLGLVATLYGMTQFFLLRRFRALESREVQTELTRFRNNVNDDIAKLSSTTNDYAEWDRTYEFMRQPTKAYIDQEFKNEALEGLGINVVLIMDTQGKIIYFKHYDLLKKEASPSLDIAAEMENDVWINRVRTSATPASGLLMLAGGPALAGACPILTSERKGPPRGIVVMTRDVDEAYLTRLKGKMRLSVAVASLFRDSLPANFAAQRSLLLSHPDVAVITPAGRQEVAGYSLFADVDGSPGIILRVGMPRDIYHQGVVTLRSFLGTLCLLSLLFGAINLVLLRRTVLAPLTLVSVEISRIGECRDLSMRVTRSGDSELSQLTGAINTMLEALQNGDKQFRETFTGIRQVFWVKDELTQEIAYLSPPWDSVSGITRERIYAGSSEQWLASVHREDLSRVTEMLDKQCAGQKGETEFRLFGPEGEVWCIWCRHFPVFNGTGRLIETVGLSEDLTDFKHSKEALVRSRDELWTVMAAVPDVALSAKNGA